MGTLDLFTTREILPVSELVGRMKRLNEREFAFVWVEGEISGLRRPGSGHYYFSLQDKKAGLRAVLFRNQAALLRFSLEDGLKVLCQGRVSVYEPRGEVQLVVDTVEPRGAGSLVLAFDQIKKRLEAQGLLAPERKQELPFLPRRVAVVTSPTGAAIRDFLKVLHRRNPQIQVAVYPVPVQGEQAPARMIRALEALAEWGWPQVIVLTRGGGAPEDLWAFNDESLAKAVAACPIPVVSAVGHEIDLVICDLAADLRAPTPSAAAEILAAPHQELSKGLASLEERLFRSGQRLLHMRRRELKSLARGLVDPRRRLGDQRLRVDDLLQRLEGAARVGVHGRARELWVRQERLFRKRPGRTLARLRTRQRELGLRLGAAQINRLGDRRARLDRLTAGLRALGPLAVLSRGYALVSDAKGRVVRETRDVGKGDLLRVRLAKGSLQTRVEEMKP